MNHSCPVLTQSAEDIFLTSNTCHKNDLSLRKYTLKERKKAKIQYMAWNSIQFSQVNPPQT